MNLYSVALYKVFLIKNEGSYYKQNTQFCKKIRKNPDLFLGKITRNNPCLRFCVNPMPVEQGEVYPQGYIEKHRHQLKCS